MRLKQKLFLKFEVNPVTDRPKGCFQVRVLISIALIKDPAKGLGLPTSFLVPMSQRLSYMWLLLFCHAGTVTLKPGFESESTA